MSKQSKNKDINANKNLLSFDSYIYPNYGSDKR